MVHGIIMSRRGYRRSLGLYKKGHVKQVVDAVSSARDRGQTKSKEVCPLERSFPARDAMEKREQPDQLLLSLLTN